MSGYGVCLLAVLIGALAPSLALASRGRPPARLLGLQLMSSLVILASLLFAQIGQSYELIVPLVLVPLSFAGTMVFVRLLGREPTDAA